MAGSALVPDRLVLSRQDSNLAGPRRLERLQIDAPADPASPMDMTMPPALIDLLLREVSNPGPLAMIDLKKKQAIFDRK
jgi:hypothetical protein